MRSRAYNKRFQLYDSTPVPDNFGGFTNTVTLLATSWAKIETLNSLKNKTDNGILDPDNSLVITTRKRNDVVYNSETQYILYRGEKYLITTSPVNTNFSDNEIKFVVTKAENKDTNVTASNSWVSWLIADGIYTIEVDGNGTIYWGDGTSDVFIGTTEFTHTYSNYNGLLKIYSDLTYIYSQDNNLKHDIANLPSSLVTYYNIGVNESYGDIAYLPSGLIYYRNEGLNKVNKYTSGRVWASNMQYVIHLPAFGYGLTSTMIDNLLIDLSITTWAVSGVIDLRGNNSPRTTASNSAVATLISKGVTVLTN